MGSDYNNRGSGARIILESERKGSNPGGFCRYYDGKRDTQGYFKYCTGSKMPSHSDLRPEHQPVYEAITFELAKRLGLKTPQVSVLLNKDKNIIFENTNGFSSSNPSGRSMYLFSELVHEPTDVHGLDVMGSNIVKREKVYLDSLNIGDVVGKRQNFMVVKRGEEVGVTYIDLGCSFVYASEGSIHLPNDLEKYFKNGSQKKDKCNLKSRTIIAADGKSLVNLEELVYGFKGLTIPTLNPFARIPLSDLISKEEIEEIDSYLIHGLCQSLHEYKEKGLLV